MADITTSKRKKRNALVHGLYASEILLPWESRKDLLRLHADLKDQFRPVGRLEEELVLDIVNCRWLKHRLMRMRQVATHSDPFSQQLIGCGKKSFGAIIKQLSREGAGGWTMINRIMDRLEQHFKKLEAAVNGSLDESASAGERERDYDKIWAIRSAITELIPVVKDIEIGPDPVRAFERGYSPDQMQKCMAVEAQIDTRFDRAISRLIMVQELRRMGERSKVPQLPKLPSAA